LFPPIDTGEIRRHLRAPTGTRIEETARITDEVEAKIRTVIRTLSGRPCSTTSACR
jgi:multidrug efflux pump subunit AcrB